MNGGQKAPITPSKPEGVSSVCCLAVEFECEVDGGGVGGRGGGDSKSSVQWWSEGEKM